MHSTTLALLHVYEYSNCLLIIIHAALLKKRVKCHLNKKGLYLSVKECSLFLSMWYLLKRH